MKNLKHLLLVAFIFSMPAINCQLKAQILNATDGADIQVFPSKNVQGAISVNVSINHTNPKDVIISANTYINSKKQYAIGRYISRDGGVSWSGTDESGFEPLQFTSATGGEDYLPQNTFDADGNAYMIAATYLPSNSGTYIMKSSNLVDWTKPLSIATSGTHWYNSFTSDDMPGSPFANYLYCSLTNGQFCRSTNGGNTFECPTSTVVGGDRTVLTGPSGEIYICWVVWKPFFVRDLFFCKSTDGGVSFSTPLKLNSIYYPEGSAHENSFNYTWAIPRPSMGIDRSCLHNGRIYITNPVFQNEHSEIEIRYSDDGGSIWSSPKTISNINFKQSWAPQLAVDDATGIVAVAYLSFDSFVFGDPSTSYITNTRIAYSIDGAATFRDLRVSDKSHITSRIKFIPSVNGVYKDVYGSFGEIIIGLAVHEGKGYAAWTDNRAGGEWQVYVSPIDFGVTIKSFENKIWTTPQKVVGNVVVKNSAMLNIKTDVSFRRF